MARRGTVAAAGRGAARHRGRRHHPGRRRRHLHRHPAAALQRHLGADEDPAARAGRLLPHRGRRAALAGRGRAASPSPRCSPSRTTAWSWPGSRAPGRPSRPPSAFGRALAATHRRGRAGVRHGRRRRRLHRHAAAAATARPPRGRSSTPPAGCCPTSSSPATGARISAGDAGRRRGRGRAGSPTSPARGAARPGCTATSGPATCVWGQDGRVWLIDPAAYGGHRETDLAMLALFGLPAAAAGARGLPGERARSPTAGRTGSPLHQLFPLLVHACLFGGEAGVRRPGRRRGRSLL